VAVKIKLKRLGKIRAPYYRIVIADSRTKRDGRAIEEIGKYHPKAEPSFIEVDSERAQHWLSVGAQPTDPVRKILEITGDWQKFKGLPGTEGTLRTAEPKADRKVAFAAAVAETLTDSGAAKAKPKGKAAEAKPAEAKRAEAKPAEAKPAEAKPAEAKARAERAPARGKKAADETAAGAAAAEPVAAEPVAAEPVAAEPVAAEPVAEPEGAESAAQAPAAAAVESDTAEAAVAPDEAKAETGASEPESAEPEGDGA